MHGVTESDMTEHTCISERLNWTQKKLLEACMPLAGVFPSWSTAVKARERQGLGRAWAVTESFRPQPSRAFQGSWRETGHCCG